ncbi:Rrf2 family transcriptional regulator [Sansalvadorimonas sp. 2012CJ34-2]|uniref:Rrf2 family transcriptional regulator n=1 Tax=Parendozoicomonas callyspongiae TaxID=2942213 RepID=A0ABT0PCL4_9GAMM|nr:Rrf2 family transcriptional regulator [Sansalvadorimonas sp. 2012CJ34-2]MCL6269065.1 Rrf2 family transcriptional regulator [Sansalvadorimonas sp. 2012CJ34-2]
MQLTRYTDYALRTLIRAALLPEGERLSVAEITQTYDTSRSQIMKVVQHLGQLGYLRNIRGKGGGIELGMEPASINIGQVVRDMENNLQMIDCNSPYCRLQPACQLKKVLSEAMCAFMKVLDSYYLSDLVEDKSRLIELLTVSEEEILPTAS